MDSGYSLLLLMFNSYISMINRFIVIGGVSILCFSFGVLIFSFIINNVFRFAKSSASIGRGSARSLNSRDFRNSLNSKKKGD